MTWKKENVLSQFSGPRRQTLSSGQALLPWRRIPSASPLPPHPGQLNASLNFLRASQPVRTLICNTLSREVSLPSAAAILISFFLSCCCTFYVLHDTHGDRLTAGVIMFFYRFLFPFFSLNSGHLAWKNTVQIARKTMKEQEHKR